MKANNFNKTMEKFGLKGIGVSKIKWYLKQLLPLLYYTSYGMNDKKYFTIWRMWFGKVFNKVEFEIK